MATPTIEPGTIEQAIYTWSKLNPNGRKGQGYGAVSPALANHTDWLATIDPAHWQLSEGVNAVEGERYDGWRLLVATGSFQLNALSIVYRKIASAGTDEGRRNRSLVHALIGRPEDLDLAAIADDDSHWLTAEDCPLDRLPKLHAIRAAELKPRSAAHACASVDSEAQALRDALVSCETTLVIGQSETVSPPDVIRSLLIAVPTALWSNIELHWFVGSCGPVARIGIGNDELPLNERVADRPERAGLGDCEAHAAADDLFVVMAAHRRTWRAFRKALGALDGASVPEPSPASPAPAAGSRAATVKPATAAATAASADRRGLAPGKRASAVVAGAIGSESWSADVFLTDREALLALDALEELHTPPNGWVATLSLAEWRALLCDMESSGSFGRAARFFDAVGATTADLAVAWRGTGVAAVGLALLNRDPENELSGRWAVPKVVDAANLRKLVEQLARTEQGVQRVSQLFHGGFAFSEGDRRRLVTALTGVGVTPKSLFGTILVDAHLPPAALLEIMREDIDGVGRWLKLPEGYTEALRLGLMRRRRRSVLNPLAR